MPAAIAERPPSALAAARELNRQRAAEESANREAERDTAYLRYVTIIACNATPEPEDAEELVALMQSLGLTESAVESDLRAIRDYRRLTELHGEASPARDDRIKASAAYLEYMEQHRREEFRLRQQAVRADDRARTTGSAIHELRKLQRNKPELFVPDTDPPQLRTDTGE